MLGEMPNPSHLCKVVELGRVDGALVLIPPGLDGHAADTLRKHVPVVRLMGAQVETALLDQVAPDNIAIGYLAAEYLLSRGCTELAFMTLSPEWSSCKLRASGFTAALDMLAGNGGTAAKAYFLTPARSVSHSYSLPTVVRPQWSEVMAEFKLRRPTGLFVPHDAELPHIYRMLSDQGIQPGRDITIVSCDNVETTLSSLVPRPVSIDLGLPTVASTAVRRLIARIETPNEPPVRILSDPSIGSHSVPSGIPL
jgi:DNA-binding LacI/PurR family transcriptional regulator